ncbi:MAG: hypothetical protein ACYTG4_02700 [Planctomycetota bacterium]
MRATNLLLLASVVLSGQALSPLQEDDGLDAVTDAIQKEVVTIRGLEFRRDVVRHWKDRDAVREEFTAESGFHDESAAEDELSASTRTLSFLGLMDPDRNVEDVTGELLAESVAGYYDPDTDEFTIVSGSEGVLNRMTIFHELIHALEDQYYDLPAREAVYRDKRQQDHIHAWRALIEGSATYFTDLYLESHPGMKAEIFEAITGIRPPGKAAGEEEAEPTVPAVEPVEDEPTTMEEAQRQARQFNSVPAFLVITKNMFPYFNGAEFLRHVLPRLEIPEGKDALGVLYADPPVSSEQILHPEKYLGKRDLPATVTLPDLTKVLGEGWKKTDENTLGELGAGLVINRWRFLKQTLFQIMAVIKPPPGGFLNNPEEFMNTPMIFRGDTGKAVGGWDGDRFAVYARGEATCLAWVSTWDSAEDAVEFADLYRSVMKKKYPGLGAPVEVTVSGHRVVVQDSVPRDRRDAVAQALEAATVTHDPADAVPAAK